MVKIRFGPAGKPISLKGDILKAPAFLRELGLDALEYEAVRGVKISEGKARRLGEEAKKNNIVLSMHAPYFINFSSVKKTTIENSIKRLNDAVRASHWMGSYIVVFHPGYYKDNSSKEEALKRVIENLKPVIEYRSQINAEDVWLGPETTGKVTQVGDLDEVIAICRELPGTRPVVDWAHLYARYQGEFIRSLDDVIQVIEMMEKELGTWAVKPLHMHFSKIEYGGGGEKRHHTLDEAEYGPGFEIVCQGIMETGIDAIIISESPVLEKDALIMKRICEEKCGVSCVAD